MPADFALTDKLIVFTSVCDEDAHHVDRYLWEIQRLEVMFCANFDRCCRRTKDRFLWSRNLYAFTEHDDLEVEFTEQHKQGVMDHAIGSGRQWALALDIDETLERYAVPKLVDLLGGDRPGLLLRGGDQLTEHPDLYDTQWLNLWNNKFSIRADGHWLQGHRANLYNIQDGRQWHFDHPITNGAKLVGREGVTAKCTLVVQHWGAIRPEWRAMRKARWDRIYGAAVGNNPYGHWRAEEDETGLKLIENPYLAWA